MSNIKNFGIQGVGPDVQFGKGGGRLVFVNGTFYFTGTPTGTTLSRVQVGDATDDNDAVNLATMTNVVNHVYAKVDKTANAVDAEISAIKAAVSTLRLDEITSSDGSYSATTAPSGLTLTAAATATSLVLDLSATGAQIRVVSTAADADLHLVPQGAGSVIIGDGTEDGIIQPQGGHSLTIAGGDADTAGNVLIRGGKGTTGGHVEIHDLLDPVEPQDPATLASSTIAIDLASKAIVIGSIRASVGAFKEIAGDTVVMPISAGTLLRLKVLITTPFTEGATITVKTSTSTLALPTTIDETQTGIYSIELLQDTAADAITVTIVSTGTTGSGSLALEYIAS